MSESDHKFQTTAKEYLSVFDKLKSAEAQASLAKDEADRLRDHLLNRAKDLGTYVGPNIRSRLFKSETGETLIVRHVGDARTPADIEIFNIEGVLRR